MNVAELITELRKLPPDAEIAILAASAFARPPVIQRASSDAWRENQGLGLRLPNNAYLLRPAPDVI